MSLLGDPLVVTQFASFTDATGDLNAVVAAVTGFKIRVTSYTLNMAGGINDITFQGGTTKLSGAFQVADQATIHAACASGLFETAAGVAFNILMSTALLVVGHVSYVLIEG